MTESAFNRPTPVQEQQAALKAEPKAAPSGLGINYRCAICYETGHISVEFPPSKRSPEYATWHAAVCRDVARDHAIHAPDCTAPIGLQLDIAKSIDEASDPPPTTPNVVPPLQDRGHLSTHPNFPNGIEIPGVGTIPVHSTAEYAIDDPAFIRTSRAQFIDPIHPIPGIPAGRELTEPKLAPGELPEGAGLTTPPYGMGEAEDLNLEGLDTVSRGAILDGLRENPITEMLDAPNPLTRLARDFQAREEAAIHSHARELTEAEATRALEAVMQERIKEALDRDIDTRARYEGSVLGNPVVIDPTMQRTIIAAVHLTAEQIAATKHLKPGEAWAKAGQSLEPEPPAKVEDLDEF